MNNEINNPDNDMTKKNLTPRTQTRVSDLRDPRHETEKKAEADRVTKIKLEQMSPGSGPDKEE